MHWTSAHSKADCIALNSFLPWVQYQLHTVGFVVKFLVHVHSALVA